MEATSGSAEGVLQKSDASALIFQSFATWNDLSVTVSNPTVQQLSVDPQRPPRDGPLETALSTREKKEAQV